MYVFSRSGSYIAVSARSGLEKRKKESGMVKILAKILDYPTQEEMQSTSEYLSEHENYQLLTKIAIRIER